jgi:hypothetical protein
MQVLLDLRRHVRRSVNQVPPSPVAGNGHRTLQPP